ncbi:hypothetical protein Hanom_Chr09g00780831 [Helianthus anomalus]
MHHVDTPDKTIKKYIRALPDCVTDFVQAARPTTIEETYQLAAEINDTRVLAGAFKTSTKSLSQVTATPSTDNAASQGSKSSCQSRKRRNNNNKNYVTTAAAPLYAVPAPPNNQNRQVVVTNAPPTKRAYTGTQPLCPICTYHHPARANYRFCANCNIYWHFTAHCRSGPRQQATPALPTPPAQLLALQGNPAFPAPVANARTCYTCGDPNYFANVYPHQVVKQEPQQQQPPQEQQQQQQPQQQQPQQAAGGRTFNINVR